MYNSLDDSYLEMVGGDEGLRAQPALVRLLPRVQPLVNGEVGGVAEGLLAL